MPRADDAAVALGDGNGGERPRWPEGKSFAFAIFDDPDRQTTARGWPVYDFLAEHGFRTTKGTWPLAPSRPIGADNWGGTCADPEHLEWVLELQSLGFEIGYHGAAPHTSTRAESAAGLERFSELLGHPPRTYTQHVFCDESVYWGEERVTGVNRLAYNALTLGRNRGRFRGSVPGDPLFWGDLCKDRVKYVRNHIYREVNTLKACPLMPYHDPDRPLVNFWFASSDGNDVNSFNDCLSEEHQDRLEAEGGACIMYTHFAFGFLEDGRLNSRFRQLMKRLADKTGWFVPVCTLLDPLLEGGGAAVIPPSERSRLERRWLRYKIRHGTR